MSSFMKLQRLSENCYAVLNEKNRLCDANSGYISGPRGGVVIDTQCDLGHARRLSGHIDSIDSAPPEIVINTHEDPDHVWGNQLFDRARVVAHHSVPARMREVANPKSIRRLTRGVERPGIRWFLHRFHPGVFAAGSQLNEDYDFGGVRLVPPTELFEDRLELDWDGVRVELIHVGPCHQVGDTLVHVPEQRVLFAGDIIFQACTPIGWAGTHGNWIAALDLIEGLQPEWIVPGHGPVCGLSGVIEMRSLLDHVFQQSKQTFDQGIPAIEAAKRIDLGIAAGWHSPARLYMSVERSYREFRGEPPETPWNLIRTFDSIFEVARTRGIDREF